MQSLHMVRGSELRLSPSRSFELIGSLPPEPRIALIGSRAAQGQTLQSVKRLMELLREENCSLVSGGAFGVDGAAHRAALAEGVPQLAVLPCGADRMYPEDHRSLFESIATQPNSGILYALPRGTPLVRNVFASRNRIVLGCCHALIVAEAWPRSGSLQTGRLALKQNLRVSALATSPGCLQLIVAGAFNLGDDGDRTAAVWLRRVVSEFRGATDGNFEDLEEAICSWPERLRWLKERIRESGAEGFSLDQCEDLIQTVCALTEAQSLGLVQEFAPGRYLAT